MTEGRPLDRNSVKNFYDSHIADNDESNTPNSDNYETDNDNHEVEIEIDYYHSPPILHTQIPVTPVSGSGQ